MADSAVVKGRFAPTPSGRMHLGNVFSSLLAWLSVRAKGGQMLLRIEDLDPIRCHAEQAQLLMDDLLWLGLNWDEGPGKDKDYRGPCLQSQRSAFYEKQLAKLREKWLLYPCFCSRAELHAVLAPHAQDGNYVYSGRCRQLTPQQVMQAQAKRPPALRVRVPDEVIGFTDGCQGYYEENLAQDAGDFILRRSDGVFAYQLAATADDGDFGITEVVRGRDLLQSTPRQIWLLRTLGYPPPQYYHVPLLVAEDGRRLAKRDADMDMGYFRSILPGPEPLLGLLAFWAGLAATPAPVSAAALVRDFDWARLRREDLVVPARLDTLLL